MTKVSQNRQNLKRLSSARSTAKGRVRYVSKTTTDHLQLMKQNLTMAKVKVKELSQQLTNLDNQYCEMEEKHNREVESSLEGTKQFVPQTMEGHKFTNKIRALYYRLLVEKMPPRKIEEKKQHKNSTRDLLS